MEYNWPYYTNLTFRTMLRTSKIPQYCDYPEDWQRFLYKASKGSYKAVDILNYASNAYMIDFTNNPQSPDTLLLTEYNKDFIKQFPSKTPFRSDQEIVDYCVKSGWVHSSFTIGKVSDSHSNLYLDLWEQGKTVDELVLFKNALTYCLNNWNGDSALACSEILDYEFDSSLVVSGLLYLALTWPIADDQEPYCIKHNFFETEEQ